MRYIRTALFAPGINPKVMAKAIASDVDAVILDLEDSVSNSSKVEILDGLISLALAQRNAARARKDFAASDEIRDSLTALGITIEDTPTGSRWTVN